MAHIVATVTNDLTFDQRMIRCCTSLVDAGYEVTLIGRKLPGSVPLVERSFRQVRLDCGMLKGPGFYAEYNIRLRSWLHSTDYDLAIACDLDTIMAVGMVSQKKDVPFVYDAHEYFTEVPELVGRPIIKTIWQTIARKYVPKAAACYTVAPQLSLKLEDEYGVPFGVVRNVPFPTDNPVLGYDERRQTILYQGALNDGRGIEAAIDAMGQIEGLTLTLAGEGDLSAVLRQRARDRGVEDRVDFLGRIQPEGLSKLTSEALVGLNLLENRGLNYYYSLANKFFDYIQTGTPSLNMNFPEYKAISEEYDVGVFIEALTVEDVIESVAWVRQKENWNACSNACKQAREVYHWDVDKKVLIEIIRGIIG